MDLLRVSDLNKKLRCYYCPWCIGGQIWQESLRCPLQWSNHDKFWCPPGVRCLNLTCDTTHGHLMAAHLISPRHSHWLDTDCLWTNQQWVCVWSAQSLDSWFMSTEKKNYFDLVSDFILICICKWIFITNVSFRAAFCAFFVAINTFISPAS